MVSCIFGSKDEAFFEKHNFDLGVDFDPEDGFDLAEDSDSESTEMILEKKISPKKFNKDGKLRKERCYGRFKYVYWKPSLKKFKASIVTNKTTRVLGAFETQEEAASEINNKCIALSIPLKNPSICFENPEIASRYMQFKVSQKYEGVLYLPKIDKYIGYLFLNKDEESKITAAKKRRKSKSKNGSKSSLYQDQYKFTGFTLTEIKAAQNINNYCVRELNIPPKFPYLSGYSGSSIRSKKTARKSSRQQQILSICLDDDALTEDEEFLVNFKKSYSLRKRKLYRKPNYVDYTLFDDIDLQNHFSIEPVCKKRKLNTGESFGICDFTQYSLPPTRTAAPKNYFDFIASPLIPKSLNKTNSSPTAASINTFETLPKAKKQKKSPPARRALSLRIAAQQQRKLEDEIIEIDTTHIRSNEIIDEVGSDSTTDKSMIDNNVSSDSTTEDEELTDKDPLSQYVFWNSKCWTARLNDRGNEVFVGQFHSKKHAINALVDYANILSIPLPDYFSSVEVEESIGSINITDSETLSEDEVMMEDKQENCSLSCPVSMELWALAGLCVSRWKQ